MAMLHTIKMHKLLKLKKKRSTSHMQLLKLAYYCMIFGPVLLMQRKRRHHKKNFGCELRAGVFDRSGIKSATGELIMLCCRRPPVSTYFSTYNHRILLQCVIFINRVKIKQCKASCQYTVMVLVTLKPNMIMDRNQTKIKKWPQAHFEISCCSYKTSFWTSLDCADWWCSQDVVIL